MADAADVESEFVEGPEESDGSEGGEAADLGPAAQAVVVACWLTLKELALLLGTLARHCPFSSGPAPLGLSSLVCTKSLHLAFG